MPDPNHMVAFATKAEISGYDFSTFPNGTPVACLENYAWYFLVSDSSAAADGEDILTSASGRFFKVGKETNIGAATPSAAPEKVGDRYLEIQNLGQPSERIIEYVATGTSSSADWKILTSSAVRADDLPSYYGQLPVRVGEFWNDDYSRKLLVGVDFGSGLEWAEIDVFTGSF